MDRSAYKSPAAVEVALNGNVRALVSGMLLEMRRFEEAGWLFVVVFDGAAPPSQGAYFRISIKGTEQHLSTHAGLCKYNCWSMHLFLFFSSVEIRLLLCVSAIWSLSTSAFFSDLVFSIISNDYELSQSLCATPAPLLTETRAATRIIPSHKSWKGVPRGSVEFTLATVKK